MSSLAIHQTPSVTLQAVTLHLSILSIQIGTQAQTCSRKDSSLMELGLNSINNNLNPVPISSGPGVKIPSVDLRAISKWTTSSTIWISSKLWLVLRLLPRLLVRLLWFQWWAMLTN
jgi:hypothetical protein